MDCLYLCTTGSSIPPPFSHTHTLSVSLCLSVSLFRVSALKLQTMLIMRQIEMTVNYYDILITTIVMYSWSSRFVSVKSTTVRSKQHREQRNGCNTGAMALGSASSATVVVAVLSASSSASENSASEL